MTTRVLVADDHPLVVTGIRTVLARDPDLEVVGTSHCGADTVRVARELRPDVVLLDVRLGDLDGAQVARVLLDAAPRLRIVMLTAFDDPGVLQTCLALGVRGILLKGSRDLDLPGALREVVRGAVVIDAGVAAALERAGSLLAEGPAVGIRPREVEVLRLMAMGMTTRDVADEMHLSVNTVRSYTQALMAKLGAHTRVQAIVQARRLEII